MNRQVIRIGLILGILAITGWVLTSLRDILLYTLVLAVSALAVALVDRLIGQGVDERSVRRSEQAALTAVRVSMLVGALGSIYGKILGVSPAAVSFAESMIVPAIIWFLVYHILNWRDTW